MIDVLQSLIRIDSQNPDLVTGAPGERTIAAYCRDHMLRHGAEAWTDEVAPGRFNAVGRLAGGAGPTIVLCAHLDTVSIDGMTIPALEPRLDDGRVYGRGAYDMKSGVAAILAAMAALAARTPRGTVLAALVADEEYASIGALDFVQRYRADACIVTEPSEGRLILAHKGFVWAEIETRGTAAHGSRWDLGVSAIGRMGRIIAALETFDRTVLRARTHPLLGPASMHCSMVSGGDGWSTFAPSCTLRVECRTLPGQQPAAVLDELRAVIRDTGEAADVREVLSRSPLECDPASPLAQHVRAAAAAVTGAAPADAGVAYWMDAAIFADAGMTTVDYGPAGEGAHAAVEWVDLDSVERCARVLELACRSFCG
ncbi:MAG TPA: M20/M25/M40 family metallo-hydrolase [Longimicrobiales bacterium]|nr:M20/M25/M40 family metallo-hydrolase [Longimicrobiales bacterium]